jgi:hypothetical protein
MYLASREIVHGCTAAVVALDLEGSEADARDEICRKTRQRGGNSPLAAIQRNVDLLQEFGRINGRIDGLQQADLSIVEEAAKRPN